MEYIQPSLAWNSYIKRKECGIPQSRWPFLEYLYFYARASYFTSAWCYLLQRVYPDIVETIWRIITFIEILSYARVNDPSLNLLFDKKRSGFIVNGFFSHLHIETLEKLNSVFWIRNLADWHSLQSPWSFLLPISIDITILHLLLFPSN